MLINIGIGVVVVLVLFLGYVSTRPSIFRYERSGVINAPPDEIYPYISNFRRGGEWSPYELKDPSMKKTFSGTDGAAGSVMDFDGSRDVGAGKLEMLKLEPNKSAQLRLFMTRPMKADHIIDYVLTPEGNGTRFSWAMSGDGGFMGKLMTTLIDCEKMVAGDMEKGIVNLKTLVESKSNGG